jgi:hypothetical protein
MTAIHFVTVRLEGDQDPAKALVQREFTDDDDQRRADLYVIPCDAFPQGRVLRGVALVDDAETVVGGEKDPEVHTAWPYDGPAVPDPAKRDDDTPPSGNASRDAWADYARSQGFSDDVLDGKGREEIKALF